MKLCYYSKNICNNYQDLMIINLTVKTDYKNAREFQEDKILERKEIELIHTTTQVEQVHTSRKHFIPQLSIKSKHFSNVDGTFSGIGHALGHKQVSMNTEKKYIKV